MSEPTVPPPPSYNPPPPPPPPYSGGPGGTGYVSPNRNLMIVLSYLGLLALIPLLVEKEDKEVQWHAKHGLVLFVTWFVVWICLTIFQMATASIDCGITGCLLQSVFSVAILVIHIMAIVKGLNGQRLILPVVSDFANRF